MISIQNAIIKKYCYSFEDFTANSRIYQLGTSPANVNPILNVFHDAHLKTLEESEQTAASSLMILDHFRQIYNLQNWTMTTFLW